jgi:hypothetical protein
VCVWGGRGRGVAALSLAAVIRGPLRGALRKPIAEHHRHDEKTDQPGIVNDDAPRSAIMACAVAHNALNDIRP